MIKFIRITPSNVRHIKPGEFSISTYSNGTGVITMLCPHAANKVCSVTVVRGEPDEDRQMFGWDGNMDHPTIKPEIGCDFDPNCHWHNCPSVISADALLTPFITENIQKGNTVPEEKKPDSLKSELLGWFIKQIPLPLVLLCFILSVIVTILMGPVLGPMDDKMTLVLLGLNTITLLVISVTVRLWFNRDKG